MTISRYRLVNMAGAKLLTDRCQGGQIQHPARISCAHLLPPPVVSESEEPEDDRDCAKTDPKDPWDLTGPGTLTGHGQRHNSQNDCGQSRKEAQQGEYYDHRHHVTQSAVAAVCSDHRQDDGKDEA